MKKNNKGFTLVEVIAVIAILSILSGITISAVTKLTTNSKKKTYKNFEDNLKKASNNYLIRHNELAEEENLKLDAQTLIDEGFLENLTDPTNKKESCNEDSYVIISGKRENATDYNITYSYDVCLKCPNYSSSKCPVTPPSEEIKPSCPVINVNITYDHPSLTNQNVVAKLNTPNEKIKIKNNGGSDSYTFKENGGFKFKYIDEENNCEGSITATVNWIDKIIPTAIIEYSHNEKTSEPVIAILTKETEPITIINNDGKNNYIFQENGTFEFIYQDQAGNIGKTLAKVDWIEKTSVEKPEPTPDPSPDSNVDPNNPPKSDKDLNEEESNPNHPFDSENNSNNTDKKDPNHSTEKDSIIKEDKNDSKEEKKKKKVNFALLFEIIVIIILVLIFFLIKKKIKKQNNYID